MFITTGKVELQNVLVKLSEEALTFRACPQQRAWLVLDGNQLSGTTFYGGTPGPLSGSLATGMFSSSPETSPGTTTPSAGASTTIVSPPTATGNPSVDASGSGESMDTTGTTNVGVDSTPTVEPDEDGSKSNGSLQEVVSS